MVKVYSLVCTLTKRLQVVIHGLQRRVLLHCAVLQNCLALQDLQVLRGHHCLDYQYKSVPLLLPMCSGSGVDLPLLIFGLLMTSTITKMTLLSAFFAQSNRQQLS